MNQFLAVWRLTLYQFFNSKRRWATLLMFILPIGVSLFVSRVNDGGAAETYSTIINQLYISLIIPFACFYLGSSLITDEIENKTLVYLWTRPLDKGLLTIFKFITVIPILCIFVLTCVCGAYAVSFSKLGLESFFSELDFIIWDFRALCISGIVYGSLGVLTAVLFKKPMAWGMVYIFFWDLLVSGFPGSLKWLSVRYYTLNLSTHPQKGQIDFPLANLFKLLKADAPPTATQAITIMVLASIAMLSIAAYTVRMKEFSADDPARNQ